MPRKLRESLREIGLGPESSWPGLHLCEPWRPQHTLLHLGTRRNHPAALDAQPHCYKPKSPRNGRINIPKGKLLFVVFVMFRNAETQEPHRFSSARGMQFSGASCGSLQFPACGGLSCGFQTWAKQRDARPPWFEASPIWVSSSLGCQDRVNCDFVMNDQVVSAGAFPAARGCVSLSLEVYYGINITELVSNTPGNAKERRRLSVVSKPGRE